MSAIPPATTPSTPPPVPASLGRVLAVDDEAQMLSIVAFALETQGFECVTAANAHAAWHLVSTEHFDLVILDVMLPDTSGITLCERIRANFPIPVILLTALGEERDRVGGLQAGADDYVTKPFSPRELALRAAAVVRRTQGLYPETEGAEKGTYGTGPLRLEAAWLECGPLRLHPLTLEAFWAEKRLTLTQTEAKLLAALLRRAGQVVPVRTLLNEAWGTDAWHGGKEMVKTTVYRLRRRLAEAAGQRELITSVRSQGYRLTPPQ